jgi:hypothetical protein
MQRRTEAGAQPENNTRFVGGVFAGAGREAQQENNARKFEAAG